MPHIRYKAVIGHDIFTDRIDFDDGFQTLELDFSRDANTVPYPKVFDSHLHSFPSATLCHELRRLSKPKITIPAPMRTTRAQTALFRESGLPSPEYMSYDPRRQHNVWPPISISATVSNRAPPSPTSPTSNFPRPLKDHNYLQFSGSGADALPFQCSGILHPLRPQHGIPGWQRITMMKYFDPISPVSSPATSSMGTFPSHGFDLNDDISINEGCWAYEGIVLPGGMIMLGRWWSPMDQTRERQCMGPFIFWSVPPPDRELSS